jgi:hypothetical protein
MPKVGEPIPSPKKMPKSGGTGGGEPPTGEVRIITPPASTTPALEVAPTAVPGLEADNRNPF